MKISVIMLSLVAYVSAGILKNTVPNYNTAYGYLTKYGITEAKRIKKAEEEYLSNKSLSRIVGGFSATTGQFKYQVGLLSDIVGMSSKGVCGGSLVTADRVLTAAHCWFDGIKGCQVDTIGTVSLPIGSEVFDNFNGQVATASGFGKTQNEADITGGQLLSYVDMNVISNEVCNIAFFGNIRSSNICTSTWGGLSTCRGDSGGPLVIQRNNRTVLIGITSFGIDVGCDIGWPAAFTRVTSFLDFINDNL